MEVRTSISLKKEIIDWINKQIKEKKFDNKSDVIEHCVEKAKHFKEMKKLNSWLLIIVLLLILNLVSIWLLH